MPLTKRILAIYPILLITSIWLLNVGMADRAPDYTLRFSVVITVALLAIGIPAIHLFALRKITCDRMRYQVTAAVSAPFIILPFIGLVIGLSIYGLLTYLLFTRCQHNIQFHKGV